MESKEEMINMFKEMGESFIENNIKQEKTSDTAISINWEATAKRFIKENEELRAENEGLKVAIIKLARL